LISSHSVICTVKIRKLIVRLCFLMMTLCCVHVLLPFIFEINMFEKQLKCNEQKIWCLLIIMEFIAILRQAFDDIFTLAFLSHSWNKFHIHQKALNIVYKLSAKLHLVMAWPKPITRSLIKFRGIFNTEQHF
jgi:hypothetical protein